jgi:hypothetical protein
MGRNSTVANVRSWWLVPTVLPTELTKDVQAGDRWAESIASSREGEGFYGVYSEVVAGDGHGACNPGALAVDLA